MALNFDLNIEIDILWVIMTIFRLIFFILRGCKMSWALRQLQGLLVLIPKYNKIKKSAEEHEMKILEINIPSSFM